MREIGGCEAGSAELRWLQDDLAANPSRCSLALWHHPRYSSGEHGSNAAMDAIWDALYDAGVELVLAGHDHLYERFAADQTRAGNLAPGKGITSFVVGTGGREFYEFGDILPTSRARVYGVAGVLRLTLTPGAGRRASSPSPGATSPTRARAPATDPGGVRGPLQRSSTSCSASSARHLGIHRRLDQRRPAPGASSPAAPRPA